ncbi:MAG: TonB-dependent receptor [Gemmatimonadota bacterium]|nr:TonB-dependent receptor [Gemmatimonadota bacterium]
MKGWHLFGSVRALAASLGACASSRTSIGALNTLLAVFLAVGLAVGDAAAQDAGHGVVSGTVRAEEDGAPLSGVSVELVDAGRTVLSDEQGRFLFNRVEVGTYTLRFHLIGHSVLERTVDVRRNAVSRPDVSLDAAPVSVDPLLVLMSRTRLSEGIDRSRVPGSVHVVGPKSIEERPVVYDDVHALLREVPGVNIQEEDGYGLRPNIGFRGTGVERSSKITLMEDGVLIAPAPYAAPAAYYFPVAGRMNAIEVRKGSSQIRYGPSTIGGALNLVSTPIPNRFSVMVDGSGGTNDTRQLRARVGNAHEHVGWMFETYQSRSDGFKRLDSGGDTGFDIQDYVGKVRVNSSLDASTYQELELKLGYYDERSDETYLGLTEADFAASPLRRYAGSQQDVMNADHQQVQLRHFARFPTGIDLTTTLYRNDFARNWYKLGSVNGTSISGVLSNPEAFTTEMALLRGSQDGVGALNVRANNREYRSQGAQTLLGATFGGEVAHDLELGVRYHEDDEDRFQHEDLYSIDNGRMTLETAGAPGSQANRISSATAWAFHLMDRIEVGDLTVAPGVRYESIDLERVAFAAGDEARTSPTGERGNSISAWIPGVGVLYDVESRFQLYGGVHKGFGPAGPGADEETEPESSVNYELGLRSLGPTNSVEVTGFFSDYDNILGTATLSVGGEGDNEVFNGGAVNTMGVEVALGTQLELDPEKAWRLPLRATYTLTRATFEAGFESDFGPWGEVEEGDHLPYLPTHQFFASGGIEGGAWTGRITASGTSAMRTVAGQGDIPAGQGTDGYVVFGAGLEYEVSSGTRIKAAVENIADARDAVDLTLPELAARAGTAIRSGPRPGLSRQ